MGESGRSRRRHMNEAESSGRSASGGGGDSPTAASPRPSFRWLATDALRYWEPRRLIYNAVLAMIVVGHFLASWPASRQTITFDGILFLFILAVLANICYTAAYIPDLFAQSTGFRPLWLRWRVLLLAVGIIFAAIMTRFFCLAIFAVATGNGAQQAL